MHDKSPVPVGACFTLPGHRVVSMTGRDAASFAQAQFMNDVSSLQPGHWQWNGWLTPKGRLLALFALLKWSEQEIRLLVPDADPVALAEGLKRYLFRSKVVIEVRNDLQAFGSFVAPGTAQESAFSELENGRVELDLGADGGPRSLWIVADGSDGDAVPGCDDVNESRWRLFDLEHGLPRLPQTQSGQWTPQQLSLERLRAFSVKKGCYPGQEIVARTHFLGKAKRGLVVLDGDAPLPVDAEVHGGDRVLASAIASADADSRHIALAVLPLEREEAELSVDTQAVRVIPARQGLAR